MKCTENWIWLPSDKYGNEPHNIYSALDNDKESEFIVAEFLGKYNFSSKVVSAALRFSGDCVFQLYCNNNFIATGPACVGGDFIGNETVRENYYAFETVIEPDSPDLCFFARVKALPSQICEYSKGHGGFMLSAILTFEDGTQKEIHTDETWLARKNGAYKGVTEFDSTIAPDEYVNAEIFKNIWKTKTAPIPVREENELFCENSNITLAPYEEKIILLTLDKIWAGFLHIKAQAQGEIHIEATCKELTEDGSAEKIILHNNCEYRGFYMHSAGNITFKIKSLSCNNAELTFSFIETHYPVFDECETVTSDNQLNNVINTCKHTLKICRQTHHLDSPRHCEPMACTGDYYIESLMTMFSFGDMRLAEFDLMRTAIMLERQNGRMFHTTYSLIWVRMLYDVYMATGNINLLKECKNALELLLKRFETYIGENGLVDNPPDYMFIDWIFIDEISMHHPPKALGQTCLNMFYFGALGFAEKIFNILECINEADACKKKRESVQKAINDTLFDKEKGVYFMGLNTPEEASATWKWMPANTKKRYYMKHANILAAYFGVCDNETSKELIRKVMANEIEGDCQPYFLHYLLEAIYRLGLRDEYTLEIISRWKKPVAECPKGLVEGFIAPEPTYAFDHSHAWGGTPLYSLPKALMGLEITEAGMKKLKLSPSLLSLESAKTELLTPYGKVVCKMEKNKAPEISYPKEIEVTII